MCGRSVSDRAETTAAGGELPKPLAALFLFFSSWRFPVLMLAVMVSFDVFQLLMLVVPTSATGLGAFAEEFRVWCYGKNRTTGALEKGYVILFLAQPAVMCGVLSFVWYRQVKEAFIRERRATLPYLFAALAIVIAVCVSLVGLGQKPANPELAFPAKALRTEHAAPALALADQNGKRVDLADLRGNVVVVTGIYATCFHTCPLIMAELRRSLDALSVNERRDVRVLAVTLDPVHDDQSVMAATAKRYALQAPEYSLLSGDPKEVDATLDRFEIARTKDPMSGQIDHANLFILVDRQGKVAYRLTLGERQEKWLVEAMKLLLTEPKAPGA